MDASHFFGQPTSREESVGQLTWWSDPLSFGTVLSSQMSPPLVNSLAVDECGSGDCLIKSFISTDCSPPSIMEDFMSWYGELFGALVVPALSSV